MKRTNKNRRNGGKRIVASFWHWRLKRRLFAKDYGHKGFPIG